MSWQDIEYDFVLEMKLKIVFEMQKKKDKVVAGSIVPDTK